MLGNKKIKNGITELNKKIKEINQKLNDSNRKIQEIRKNKTIRKWKMSIQNEKKQKRVKDVIKEMKERNKKKEGDQ